jgi:subtilase family serine protease
MVSRAVSREERIPVHRSGTSGSRSARQRRTAAALAAVLPALALTVTTALPASAGTPSRVALPSPNPTGLTGTVAALDPSQPLDLRVHLSPRPGLAAAAIAVSNPHDPGYAHFLTPDRYQQRYGATSTQTVGAWLTSQGLTVTATTQHYLAVTATVAQVDAAFATQVSEYDTTFVEPWGTFVERDAGVVGGFSVPAALGGDILSVTGIEQTPLSEDTASTKAAARARTHAAKAKTTSAFQCSQYWGQHTEQIPPAYGHTSAPTQLCGYTPDQVRKAYGVATSPYTGKGSTIAVILNGHTSTMLADANRYFAGHGLAGFAPGQYTENIGPDVDSTCAAEEDSVGDPEEESIDVESSHIAAPDAKVVYVAADCASIDGDLLDSWLDAATRVVDQHLADVVSGSWGLQESGISPADTAAWDPVFQQGAVEGIGFNFSSGDGGDVVGDPADPTAANIHNVQFPSSDPWATSVGGTSLAIGQDGSAVADYPWGDNVAAIDPAGTGYETPPPGEASVGSGGGVSTMFAEPGYQRSVVPTTLSDNASRVVPDVSADAGNTWLIGYTDAFDTGEYIETAEGGGTSASSPLIAGLEADAMQALGHPLGFANPVLYGLSGSKAIRDILPVNPADPPIAIGEQQGVDIVPDHLVTFGEDATLTSTAGYDDVTGLGAATASFVAGLGKH